MPFQTLVKYLAIQFDFNNAATAEGVSSCDACQELKTPAIFNQFMHLQQTKVGSRATGGPQYYFHSVSSHVKEFLRTRGACPVVLQTPYQIMRYTELPRAVVLCIEHDLVNPPDHVDILELSALADYLRS